MGSIFIFSNTTEAFDRRLYLNVPWMALGEIFIVSATAGHRFSIKSIFYLRN
jgi:hypothetical protein